MDWLKSLRRDAPGLIGPRSDRLAASTRRQCPLLGSVSLLGITLALYLAHPDQSRGQQVNDAMTWALRSSISLKSDDARQSMAEARFRGSIEAFLPRVEWQQETILSSRYVYTPYAPPPIVGSDTLARRQPDRFGVQATLPLFDGFRRYNMFKAASLGVEAGKYLAINARQQVMLDAAQSYLAVVRDRAIVDFRRRQVDNIARMVDVTAKRYELRDSTHTDVALSDSRLLAAKAALEAARADLASSEIEFVRITGTTAGRFASPKAPDWLVPKSKAEIRDAIVNENPQLAASRLDAKAAKFTAEAAHAEVLPTVNLIASHGQANGTADYTPRITDTTVKLQIRIPIYEPGAMSRISEAKALAMQKNYDSIDNQMKTAASAETLFVTRQSLIQQTARASERVSAMRRAVEGYKVEQAAGYRTIVDVLNALNELAEAEVFQANMVYTRDKSTYMIVAALARLEPSITIAER